MPFTGKSTFDAGATLPELVDDVSDVIGIVSPFETPLLNHLGDAKRPATSTIHEWLEDTLLPNTDSVNPPSCRMPLIAPKTGPRSTRLFGLFSPTVTPIGAVPLSGLLSTGFRGTCRGTLVLVQVQATCWVCSV